MPLSAVQALELPAFSLYPLSSSSQTAHAHTELLLCVTVDMPAGAGHRGSTNLNCSTYMLTLVPCFVKVIQPSSLSD